MQDQNEQANGLRKQFVDVRFPMHAVEREELRARVLMFTAEAKANEWPPERVIIRLKQIANDALGRAPTGAAREQLLMDVVTWCIEGYYRPTAD